MDECAFTGVLPKALARHAIVISVESMWVILRATSRSGYCDAQQLLLRKFALVWFDVTAPVFSKYVQFKPD